MDWAMDWGAIEVDDDIIVAKTRVTIVEQAVSQPYSVLSMIDIFDFSRCSIDGIVAHQTFRSLTESITDELSWSVLLEDQFEKTKRFDITREVDGVTLSVVISSRRLGEDTGRDILFHAGRQIKQIAKQISELPILKNS
jgi:hypothetical protein